MPAGRAAWRAIMRAHDQLPGELYNSLDKSFLINYCMAVEARQRAQDLQVKISKDYQDGKAVLQDLLKVRAELRMAQRLVSDLEKQLYLTPKSRGGVTPPAKEKSADEIIASELAALDRMLGGENQDDRVS